MKKTIVFLHPHFLKPGGASKVVLEQSSRLKKLGFKCELLYSKLSTGSLLFWLMFPFFFFNLVRKLNSIPEKAVFCHSLAIYWGYLYKLLYPKTTIIIYFHDLGFPYFDSELETKSLPPLPGLIIKLLRPFFEIIHKNIILRTNYLVANSKNCAKFVLDKYQRQVDLVCTPGVDLKTFKPIGAKKNYIITVGRLEKIKNIETVIKGFVQYVQKNNSELTLKIVGEGPERYTSHKQIEFLGKKSPKELAKLYAEAILGVYMSPNESFGLTAIECLACGTPIIGVNQNGILEIIQGFDNSFAVANSPDALTNKLVQIIPGKLSAKISLKARQSVEKYSWDNQVKILSVWLKSFL